MSDWEINTDGSNDLIRKSYEIVQNGTPTKYIIDLVGGWKFSC